MGYTCRLKQHWRTGSCFWGTMNIKVKCWSCQRQSWRLNIRSLEFGVREVRARRPSGAKQVESEGQAGGCITASVKSILSCWDSPPSITPNAESVALSVLTVGQPWSCHIAKHFITPKGSLVLTFGLLYVLAGGWCQL